MDLVSFARFVIGSKPAPDATRLRQRSIVDTTASHQIEIQAHQEEMLHMVERSRGSTLMMRHVDIEKSVPSASYDGEDPVIDDASDDEETDPYAVVAQRVAKKHEQRERKSRRRSQTHVPLTSTPSFTAKSAAAATSPFNKLMLVSTDTSIEAALSAGKSPNHLPQPEQLAGRSSIVNGLTNKSSPKTGALSPQLLQSGGPSPTARHAPYRPVWLDDDNDSDDGSAYAAQSSNPGGGVQQGSKAVPHSKSGPLAGGLAKSISQGRRATLAGAAVAAAVAAEPQGKLIGGYEPSGGKGRGRRRSVTISNLDDALSSALAIADTAGASGMADGTALWPSSEVTTLPVKSQMCFTDGPTYKLMALSQGHLAASGRK